VDQQRPVWINKYQCGSPKTSVEQRICRQRVRRNSFIRQRRDNHRVSVIQTSVADPNTDTDPTWIMMQTGT
jgi:hypothetical protein